MTEIFPKMTTIETETIWEQQIPILLKISESAIAYPKPVDQWLLVLVDCPNNQGLYTYKVPEQLEIKIGDILSVPFGKQLLRGIAVGFTTTLPSDLTADQIREVDEIVINDFFSPTFWPLLHRVANYYCTPLMTVIKAALPPGLLAKSQRRVRLNKDKIPKEPNLFCSASGLKILRFLQTSKAGDYSYRYLEQQFKSTARSGIKDLLKRGWVESYLEEPKTPRAQLQKAVTLLNLEGELLLTEKQQLVLKTLKHQGGECWLTQLMSLTSCNLSLINTLEKKGYVTITQKEKLRLLAHPDINRDQTKVLTKHQQQALNDINQLQGFHQILLHGVTGSGKTEVYLQAIAPILAAGKSVLILVPEIGLTPQLTDRFRARFGNKVLVYHSALSEGERYDTWRQLLNTNTQIVIGTRSAIFLPLKNIGLIVLDEEHDGSFKQSQTLPLYHARTVAKWRAELENCPLILGSATPSLETWLEVKLPSQTAQVVHYLSLPDRVQSRPLPPITIVDMRQELKTGNRSIFSRALKAELAALQPPQQAILFINRRGYSTFVSCRGCGFVIECPNCDVSLSYHYTQTTSPLLRCHYCNHSETQPKHCPDCGSPYLKFFGSGTQKVTEALTEEFPHLRWLRFDSDTTRQKGEHRRLLDRFRQGEADVLVGTQMLTKGLDIEEVTLVGAIAADSLLHFADYRAAERAFQTLTQVAGRAGRGDDPGLVIIQTYNPDHPVLEAVQAYDYLSFIERELPQRQALNYPPYGHLLLIRLNSLDSELVEKTAINFAEYCQNSLGSQAEILGPAPATIMRVAERYRWHLVLKFLHGQITYPDLEALQTLCPRAVSFSIDIDPLYIE